MFNPQEYLKNPIFDVPDPQKEYKERLKVIENEQIELERLCYEVFHVNDNGKKLWEICKDKFIDRGLFDLGSKHFDFFKANPMCVSFYWEGFKDAIRGFHLNGLKHRQRIVGIN